MFGCLIESQIRLEDSSQSASRIVWRKKNSCLLFRPTRMYVMSIIR